MLCKICIAAAAAAATAAFLLTLNAYLIVFFIAIRYMEEAAFMDLQLFYEVIVPLLEVDRTALICISTPQVCKSARFCQSLVRFSDTFHIYVFLRRTR